MATILMGKTLSKNILKGHSILILGTYLTKSAVCFNYMISKDSLPQINSHNSSRFEYLFNFHFYSQNALKVFFFYYILHKPLLKTI